MHAPSANAGLLAHVAPQAGRFINRNILGLQPDPDHWPMPHNAGSLPVPTGITLSDDAGQTLILDREFTRPLTTITGKPRGQKISINHTRFTVNWVQPKYLKAIQ